MGKPDHGKKAFKPKGHKRPRGWHRGRATGRRAVAAMDALAVAFEAAAEDRAAVVAAAGQHRELVRDHEALMRGLARAAPFVPLFDAQL